jgi:DNA polymerase I-like protein with 3'-5' exonuclease and polymerase domains/uracil-DNA glycosylase
MNLICEECKHHKEVLRPCVEPMGKMQNPEVVFVLPYPDADEDKEGESARLKMLRSVIGDKIDDVCITYAVKCPTYENIISKNRVKPPIADTIKHCKQLLEKEFKMYGDARIVTLGSFAFDIFKPHKDIEFMRDAFGSVYDIDFIGIKHKLIVDIDPNMLSMAKHHALKFERTINLALDYDQIKSNVPQGEILNPVEAIAKMDEIINLYKSGQILYTVFDIENSISFNPWEEGEIIMICLAHEMDDKAYSIPLVINNDVRNPRIQHVCPSCGHISYAKKVNKCTKCKHETINTREEPFGWEIPNITWEISLQEKLQLKAKIGELLRIVPIVGHNLKYDLKWLVWEGFVKLEEVKILCDTINLAFQIFNKTYGLSLKDLAQVLCYAPDWDTPIHEYLKRLPKNEQHYGNIPTGLLGGYGWKDGYYNKSIYKYMNSFADEDAKKMAGIVDKEIYVFVEAELKGFKVDEETFKFLDEKYREVVRESYEKLYELPYVQNYIYAELIPALSESKQAKFASKFDMYNSVLPINSVGKIATLLYHNNYYNLPIFDKTDTGAPSTSADTIEKVLEWVNDGEKKKKAFVGNSAPKPMNPEYVLEDFTQEELLKFEEGKKFIQLMTYIKRIEKLQSSYIEPIKESTTEFIYRTQFNLNGTVTGRTSSPFHSMPRTSDIKRLIVSRWKDKGGLFFAPDYSQLEYRCVAHLANEQKFIEGFKRGEDVHAITASEIYGLPISEITSEQRQVGKTTNFAVLYLKIAETLAVDLGKTVEEAKKILNNFYSGCSSLKQWQQDKINYMYKTGTVKTFFGRAIPIMGSNSPKVMERLEAERQSVNFDVQATASDLTIQAVIDIYSRLKNSGVISSILGVVHDSIEVDIYPGELFRVLKIFKFEAVDSVYSKFGFNCPLEMSYEIGDSWGGSLESKIIDLSGDYVKLHSVGNKKDFDRVIQTASEAYKVNIKELSTKENKIKAEYNDEFFADPYSLEAEIELSVK